MIKAQTLYPEAPNPEAYTPEHQMLNPDPCDPIRTAQVCGESSNTPIPEDPADVTIDSQACIERICEVAGEVASCLQSAEVSTVVVIILLFICWCHSFPAHRPRCLSGGRGNRVLGVVVCMTESTPTTLSDGMGEG